MDALLFIALLGAFIAVVIDLLNQLPTTESHKIRKWLIQWFIKGAIVPIVVWTLFNLGVFDNLPDFASAGMIHRVGSSANAKMLLIFAGTIVITTYWTALSSAWLLAMMTTYSIDHREVWQRVRWLFVLLSPLAI